jgi:hypothetical protein
VNRGMGPIASGESCGIPWEALRVLGVSPGENGDRNPSTTSSCEFNRDSYGGGNSCRRHGLSSVEPFVASALVVGLLLVPATINVVAPVAILRRGRPIARQRTASAVVRGRGVLRHNPR